MSRRVVRALALGIAAALSQAAVPAAAQTILVGAAVPDTGPAAAPALWQRWGINLAIEEINAAGGLLGRKVELMAQDDRCNPSEAVNAVNKLIEAKVIAILGAHCSSATIAAMPLVAQAKIPLIEGIASSPRITEQSGDGKNEWTFRINPSDLDMMKALGIYLSQNTKFRRIASVGEDTDFGRGGATAFAEVAKADGLTIISTDFHPQSQPDFTPLLTRLQQARPDAIAMFNLTGDQLNFLRTAMQLGLKIPFTGRFDPGGANEPIVKAGGLDGSITAWTYSADVDVPSNKAFADKVRELHKMSPNLQTWAGYDTMRVLAAAVTAAGSTDPEKIRQALKTQTFTSVMGTPIKFDANNQGGHVVAILGIADRKATVKKLVELP